MKRSEALKLTKKKFTNLIDGSILPNISVEDVIKYYESMLNNQPIKPVRKISNIESNFLEESIEEMFNQADYWDGDASY